MRRLPTVDQNQPDFTEHLARGGLEPLVRSTTTTLQVNVGKRCNQACHHCHVEAGPKRTEMMSRDVAERVVALLRSSPTVTTLDLTGGAPELNPHFRWLVTEARALGRRVIDRCNLTILFEPGMSDLAEFLAAHDVEVVASLPCYSAENVENQRGRGVFDKSIKALRRLNALGYGVADPARTLNLVYNPVGASLPPSQAGLQEQYKRELAARFGITFDRLFTITNMPIRRFAAQLDARGEHGAYMALLVQHFNDSTLEGLMCRSLVSVGWDGRLYDCDFNQMLDIGLGAGSQTVFEIETLDDHLGGSVATGSHCFGCTAGSGSSCGGALE